MSFSIYTVESRTLHRLSKACVVKKNGKNVNNNRVSLCARVVRIIFKRTCVELAMQTICAESWTNNAAESMNHLLKLSIDWHPRRLPELVARLYKVTSVQMSDLRCALYGHGNYTLTAPYNKFSLPHTSWQSKTPEVYIFLTIT